MPKDLMPQLIQRMMQQMGDDETSRQVTQLEPFDMFSKLGRLDLNQFGGLARPLQEKYLEGLHQAESHGFSKVYADWLSQYNPGMKGGGLTTEYIRNALTPYYDVMRTGQARE